MQKYNPWLVCACFFRRNLIVFLFFSFTENTAMSCAKMRDIFGYMMWRAECLFRKVTVDGDDIGGRRSLNDRKEKMLFWFSKASFALDNCELSRTHFLFLFSSVLNLNTFHHHRPTRVSQIRSHFYFCPSLRKIVCRRFEHTRFIKFSLVYARWCYLKEDSGWLMR